MSGYTPGMTAWKLLFQLSPIILTNGIMQGFPGGMLPIIAITESINFPLGLLAGGDVSIDKFFANYQPLPGSSLIDQDLARYPFANATVAANSVMTMPLQISMLMICPVQNKLGWYEKLAVIMALREVLYQHNARGGTYTIATPSYIYTNCVMRSMRDSSVGLTRQVQNAWQLDFERPLITAEDAAQAQNGLMSAISSGGQVTEPAFSGLGAASSTPMSLAGNSLIPAQLTNVAGNTAVAGSSPLVTEAFAAPTGTFVTGGGSFAPTAQGPLGGGGV